MDDELKVWMFVTITMWLSTAAAVSAAIIKSGKLSALWFMLIPGIFSYAAKRREN